MAEKRFFVFLGNFGSGKTELALDFSKRFAAAGKKTTLVDLDIINPYFRASERALAMKQAGIELITPRYAMSNVEIITIDPRIYSAFVDNGGVAIFDVGGDNVGARAMGQYKQYFSSIRPDLLEVWLVVNVHRPLSATAERILGHISAISDAARLQVTGLIHNSNMSYETTPEDLAFGYPIIREVAERSGLPVKYTSGEPNVLQGFLALSKERGFDPKYIGEPLEIHTMMHRDWDRFTKYGV